MEHILLWGDPNGSVVPGWFSDSLWNRLRGGGFGTLVSLPGCFRGSCVLRNTGRPYYPGVGSGASSENRAAPMQDTGSFRGPASCGVLGA